MLTEFRKFNQKRKKYPLRCEKSEIDVAVNYWRILKGFKLLKYIPVIIFLYSSKWDGEKEC